MTRPYHAFPCPSRQQGFTLIELLVSLAILSMVATMLLGGVVSAGALTRRAERADRTASEISAAQTILRQRIEGLRPVIRLDSSDPMMDVGGTEGRFDFFAVPPAGDPTSGVQKYRLVLSATGDLILFRAPELTDSFDLRSYGVTGWKASRLIGGATSLSISYYGAGKAGPLRSWRSFWDDNATAPELVRIRVGFAPGDPRVWPDLVIRPAVSVDLACDPETQARNCGNRA